MTLFEAATSGRGPDEVRRIFRSIASRWSDCTDQRAIDQSHGLPGEASTA